MTEEDTKLTVHSITTAVPTSLSSAYNAYGSAIASWWSANGAEVSSVRRECPNIWDYAREPRVFLADIYLNDSRVLAECWSEQNPGGVTSVASITPSATRGSGVTEPASTGGASRGYGRGMMGLGMAVAVVMV